MEKWGLGLELSLYRLGFYKKTQERDLKSRVREPQSLYPGEMTKAEKIQKAFGAKLRSLRQGFRPEFCWAVSQPNILAFTDTQVGSCS